MKTSIYLIDTNIIDVNLLLTSKFLDGQKDLFSKFKVEQAYNEHIASTYLKNRFVGDYYAGKYKKPKSKNTFFNISHSKGVVAIALNKESPVGIDIEKIRKVKDSLIRHVCTEKEAKYVKTDEDFFKIWTNKEAILKAKGTGFNIKPKEIEIIPDANIKTYLNKTYVTKTLRISDIILTVALESDNYTDLDIDIEILDFKTAE